MGFNISIGEAIFYTVPDENYITIDVVPVRLDYAPAFGEDLSDHVNERYPSYTVWHNFINEAGLHNLFFNEDNGLMRQHPGQALLNEKALKEIKDAREAAQNSNGGKKPGFWDDEKIDNNKDPILARLLWLEFWVEWALVNCKNPVIVNS